MSQGFWVNTAMSRWNVWLDLSRFEAVAYSMQVSVVSSDAKPIVVKPVG
jgi:hypothetical protein